MRKIIVLTLLSLFVVSINAQTSYTINVTVPLTIKADFAVMSYPPDDKGGPYRSDTVAVKNGKFEFSGSIGRPQLAELNLITPRPEGLKASVDQSGEDVNNMKNVALFYLDGTIDIMFDNAGIAAYAGGGRDEIAWREYEKMVLAKKEAQQGSPSEDEFIEFFQQVITEFIKGHPDSYVCVDLMDMFTQSSIEPEIVGPMYNALSNRMQNSEKVLGWVDKLKKAKLAVSGNQTAPDFTMNDAEGNPISLSSYRGSYVLVDFWASWCVPCRAENPNVLAAYEKYKGKNFQVISISLDSNKGSWQKAVVEDKLPWKQLCDFKADQSEVVKLYEIYSVPANVLIDPNGKIIGKNLRGKALHDRLAELFK